MVAIIGLVLILLELLNPSISDLIPEIVKMVVLTLVTILEHFKNI